ncbi:unnamed protein product [Urochloa humidicola]
MAGSARVTGAYLCCLVVVFAAVCSCSSSSYEVQDMKDDIMRYCRFYMQKNMGSPFPEATSVCCQYVRSANVAQICQEFTDQDKAKIQLYKWVTVTRVCQNPLTVGFNCAGYIVPPLGSH